MAEENTADTNVIQFPNANPHWAGDIKTHATLIIAFRETVMLQKTIAQSLKACEDFSDKADACLYSLPSKAKARIALRGALKKARGLEEPDAREKLMQEHAFLARQKKLQLAAIKKLEPLVLSAHPDTMNESQRLLRFMTAFSDLKRKGNKHARTDANNIRALTIAKPAIALNLPSVRTADCANL